MNVYTFELCHPWNSKTRLARVHKGDFETNRDHLDPCMISTREFMAKNDKEAKEKVRKVSKLLKAKFDTTME